MKRKTLLVLLFVAILSAIMTIPVMTEAAFELGGSDSVVGVPEFGTLGNEEYFFANGAAVTVEARTDGEQGAVVKWTENGVEKSQVLGANSNIFGGMHNNDTPVTTSITINGGYVDWVHGGGLHVSHTTESNVVMNGGQVSMIKGGGADQWVPADCGCASSDRTWTDGDYENAPSQTDVANVTINRGIVEKITGTVGAIMGGGNGYANTKVANVTINGGDLTNASVSAGGSNGNTGTATLKITGGEINMVQSVNRGKVANSTLEITGGEIEKVYVTAAGDNGTVTDSVNVEVSGTAKVTEFSMGKNGGVAVDPKTDTVVKTENIKIASNSVEIFQGDLFNDVTTLYKATIDGVDYFIEEGKTIKAIPEYDEIIKKDGYDFVEFRLVSVDLAFNPDTVLDTNVELVTVFEEIEEEPPVGDGEGEEQPPVGDGEGEGEEQPPVGDGGEGEEQPPVDEDKGGKDNTPGTGVETATLSLVAVVGFISLVALTIVKRGKRSK